MPKEFRKIYGYLVTDNKVERTHGIYSVTGELLCIVNEGEILAAIREIESERD